MVQEVINGQIKSIMKISRKKLVFKQRDSFLTSEKIQTTFFGQHEEVKTGVHGHSRKVREEKGQEEIKREDARQLDVRHRGTFASELIGSMQDR